VLKKPISAAVCRRLMRPTVDFNDESFQRAKRNGGLSPKLESAELRIAQTTPKPLLRLGRVVSKLPDAGF